MRDQKLSLEILFKSLWGATPPGSTLLEQPISRVIIDSREAVPGSLFVALKGENQDGHDFIANALHQGSVAVIAEPRITEMELPDMTFIVPGQPLPEKMEPPYAFVVEDALAGLQQLAATWRRVFPALRVVGVTGSVGKTSVKELAASVLSQRYATIRSRGNYNNEIGLPLTMLRFTSKHQRAVLEMGMYAPGEIRQLAAQALPSIGIVTNVGPTHLERLGTLDAITDAKAELVEALPAGGTAILNGDDPRVLAMAGRTKANVFTYGLSPTCDLWANNIESRGMQGVRFQLPHARRAPVRCHPLAGTAQCSQRLGCGQCWADRRRRMGRNHQRDERHLGPCAAANRVRHKRLHHPGRHLQRQPGFDDGRFEPAGRFAGAKNRRTRGYAGTGQLRTIRPPVGGPAGRRHRLHADCRRLPRQTHRGGRPTSRHGNRARRDSQEKPGGHKHPARGFATERYGFGKRLQRHENGRDRFCSQHDKAQSKHSGVIA